MKSDIAVLGGTGFLGKHLAAALSRGGTAARFLVHRDRPAWTPAPPVEFVPASLDDPGSVRRGVGEARIVLNLLRPDGSGERLTQLSALLPAILDEGVTRLIHCSSIDVFGDAPEPVVTEATVPRPTTPYAREHLAIEQHLGADPRTAIVRLGAVFGDDRGSPDLQAA